MPKLNSWTPGEVHKKNFNTMRFTHNEVYFVVTYESQQNWYKRYVRNILKLFDNYQMTSKFQVTSKFTSLSEFYYVNLFSL